MVTPLPTLARFGRCASDNFVQLDDPPFWSEDALILVDSIFTPNNILFDSDFLFSL